MKDERKEFYKIFHHPEIIPDIVHKHYSDNNLINLTGSHITESNQYAKKIFYLTANVIQLKNTISLFF